MIPQHDNRNHLFTVRVWPERVDRDHIEWRGGIRHVPSDEKRYFHRWYSLISFIVENLDDQAQD